MGIGKLGRNFGIGERRGKVFFLDCYRFLLILYCLVGRDLSVSRKSSEEGNVHYVAGTKWVEKNSVLKYPSGGGYRPNGRREREQSNRVIQSGNVSIGCLEWKI